jgi:hypothetical protein
MNWFLAKIDNLAGTLIAAASGLAAAQIFAFIHAYLQRLGGHLDEARRGQGALLNGQSGAVIQDEALRGQVSTLTQARIDALDQAYRAIDQAGGLAKPFIFFQHFDPDIAAATAQNFVPALPLDMPSLVYSFAGIVLGWMLWELVKAPVAILARRPAPAPKPPRRDPGFSRLDAERQRPGEDEKRRRADAQQAFAPFRQK